VLIVRSVPKRSLLRPALAEYDPTRAGACIPFTTALSKVICWWEILAKSLRALSKSSEGILNWNDCSCAKAGDEIDAEIMEVTATLLRSNTAKRL